MTLEEAIVIYKMGDPFVCRYKDAGRLCHLINEYEYCVYCSKSDKEINELSEIYNCAVKKIKEIDGGLR